MDCYYVSRRETEEELWRDGTENLVKVHGMKADEITPQLKERYKQYIGGALKVNHKMIVEIQSAAVLL
jgi:hypothetical protein